MEKKIQLKKLIEEHQGKKIYTENNIEYYFFPFIKHFNDNFNKDLDSIICEDCNYGLLNNIEKKILLGDINLVISKNITNYINGHYVTYDNVKSITIDNTIYEINKIKRKLLEEKPLVLKNYESVKKKVIRILIDNYFNINFCTNLTITKIYNVPKFQNRLSELEDNGLKVIRSWIKTKNGANVITYRSFNTITELIEIYNNLN